VTTATAPKTDRQPQFRAISFGEFVDLELRADGDGRTFYGIAVPWEVETDLDGYAHEVWTRGAFNHQLRAANRVSASLGHIPLGGSLIGSLRQMRDDSKGLYVEGHISDVPDGNIALTLMTDKALRELSIGFYRVPGGDATMRRTDGGILIRMNKANLFEVALTPMGQYGNRAQVGGLREQAQPGRERIEVSPGFRTVAIHVDGVEVASYKLPGAGQVTTTVDPAPEPEPVVDQTIADLDGMLSSLPDISL
jgi:HK97 family phage prohead protease